MMFFSRKQRKVGIAFGGGGARGFAHIGVIKALYENGIIFNYAAGCSAGSVAAAMYAIQKPYQEIYSAMKNLKKEDFLSSRLFFVPSNPKRVEDTMHTILGENDNFEACKIPLSVLSVDVKMGAEYVFKSGIISHAISASCAVPGLFSPVAFNDMLLMDGGLMNNIPASVLRDAGCDAVVSVEVTELTTPVAKSASLIDVISASITILVRSNSVKGTLNSDIVIRPETRNYKFSKIEDVDGLIEQGYKATMALMPQIKMLFK